MSQLTHKQEIKLLLDEQSEAFNSLAQVHGVKAFTFEREIGFAFQHLSNNDYLLGVAIKDKLSLRNAVLNAATVGLTLSPVDKLAYLVPRKGKVYLDVSYMGLVRLLENSGSIEFVRAGLVYSNDKFEMTGVTKEPTHNFSPFGDRGEVVGVYMTAKLPSGEFLSETMTKEEVDQIMKRSEAYKSGKNCPWTTDWGEMAKKTVIKRAYKLLPKIAKDSVAKAISVVNEHEGIEFKNDSNFDVDGEFESQINEELLDWENDITVGESYLFRYGSRRRRSIRECLSTHGIDHLDDYYNKLASEIKLGKKIRGDIEAAKSDIEAWNNYLDNHYREEM